MVTAGAFLREITAMLKAAGCAAPAFDARCLLEDIGNLGRGKADPASTVLLADDAERAVREAAAKRAAGTPLQYLLGEWDFLSLTLKVGEGVLIPRPDTEVLCEAAAEFLKERRLSRPSALDLCAGTGCVGLGLASLVPTARVTAVELSEEAFSYLVENCDRYPALSVKPTRGDVLRDVRLFPGGQDLILSNPPYVRSADLSSLMPEVRREPRLALDGGEDGLRFYRVLAKDWVPLLAENGALFAEVGAGLADEVASLWRDAGLFPVRKIPDAAGVERVVAGIRPGD